MGTGNSGLYSGTTGSSGRTSCGGRIQATQFLQGERDRHYGDHAYGQKNEFDDAITIEEYEERAKIFFDKPVTKNILWFEDKFGYLYKYDTKKREFGICSPEGAIITYFRPEDGLKYWYRQVEKNGT